MTTWQQFERAYDAGRAMHGRNEFDRPGEGADFCRRLSLPQASLVIPLEATVWLHHGTREPVWLQLQQQPAIAYLARRRRRGDWVERLWDRRGGEPSFQLRNVDGIDDLWGYVEYPLVQSLFGTAAAMHSALECG